MTTTPTTEHTIQDWNRTQQMLHALKVKRHTFGPLTTDDEKHQSHLLSLSLRQQKAIRESR